jgi:photosystem II stability/assembly factor-like uncharacterized protein
MAEVGRKSDWPTTSSRWKSTFWSADHRVEWAVGEKGAISRFLPGGEWTSQTSGVDSDLSAGSAPTGDVCWVVGRSGIVLRTVDGEHWGKIDSPTAEDLTALTADSASSAIVTARGGQQFATTDGGLTWRQP